MRRRLPDRRRGLRAAAVRRAVAQAARAARRLPRSRRQAGGGDVPRRRARRRIDRRAGAPRRRTAGECAAGAGQRSDAGRIGSDRGIVGLWRVGRALAHPRQAAPRHDRPHQDHRAGGADPRRARLCRRARRDHRDRRSGCARRDLARDRADGWRGQAGDLLRRRRQARRGTAGFARTARGRAGAGRYRGAAARRAVRHRRGQCRRLHAVPVLRVGLPDRRAVGRSRKADAALRRGRLRAMRAVPGDLPGESDQPEAADRFPRRHRHEPHHQAGRAVRLHPLRQAVRRQELGRARAGQARRPALDVQGLRRHGSTSSRCAPTAASR